MVRWNTLASRCYGAAGLLAREQYERCAISRAYYAVYSRITHALVLRGVTFMVRGVKRGNPSHAALPALVENHLQVLGQHRWVVANCMRALYRLRVTADYFPVSQVNAEIADKAIALITKIFVLTKGVVD